MDMDALRARLKVEEGVRMTTILLGRDGTHANDTYSGDVQVNGVKLSLGAN